MKRRFAVVGALVAGMVAPVAVSSGVANAATVSTPTITKYFSAGTATPIKGLAVSGLSGKNVLATITTKVVSGSGLSGTLSLDTTTGLTLSYGFDSFSGTTLSFTGSQENVNIALRTLKLTVPNTNGVSPSAITLNTMFTEAKDGMVYNPANQHFYKYILGQIKGADAYTAAAAQTEFGLTGYLATITSEDENDFLSHKIFDGYNVWVNGTDMDTEGAWKFKGGPEDGTQFWQGWEASFTAQPGSAVNGAFTAWADGEPNNWNSSYHQVENSPTLGEDCIVLNKFSPLSAPPNNLIQYNKWNDLSCQYGTGAREYIKGYLVEFGTKTVGSTFDSSVEFREHTLVKLVPTQPLSPVAKFLKFIFGGKKLLSGLTKIKFTKPATKKAPAKQSLCPTTEYKKLRVSYTLIFSEAGRYSVYFTNKLGKRVPLECGSVVNKRVLEFPVSAPVLQVPTINARPVITAFFNAGVTAKGGCVSLNVILRRPDGTLERQDQPVPPLPGPPLDARAVARVPSC